MTEMRSAKIMNGRVFAGARALYRAAGVKGDDMGKKPIIAIANSFDEFLPGHVHLNKVGRIVSEAIKEAGGIPREFNTMAVDDGIAMGHTGMLYSLPSRDIIADTVEYQCNAHCADALICIPNCDKVVPGMLMAALRLNIPTVFVSGGPMEAGTTILADGTVKSTDLIDVMYATADDSVSDDRLPDLRLLRRHVHRQLDELPDRGHRLGAARQRHDPRLPLLPQGPVQARRAAGRQDRAPVL